MKLRIYSEGALDVGDHEREGAVAILVERVLRDASPSTVLTIERGRLPRFTNVSGYERKVRQAIVDAAADACTHVVVVVDRDGERNKGRLGSLQQGRSAAEQAGYPLAYQTVVAVAIEMVEAWLLADEKALTTAVASGSPVQAHPDPESFDGAKGSKKHPKTAFRALASDSAEHVASVYDAVARLIRLEVLEKRCPRGFAPLAEALRAWVR